jgi:hypothetical protein
VVQSDIVSTEETRLRIVITPTDRLLEVAMLKEELVEIISRVIEEVGNEQRDHASDCLFDDDCDFVTKYGIDEVAQV